MLQDHNVSISAIDKTLLAPCSTACPHVYSNQNAGLFWQAACVHSKSTHVIFEEALHQRMPAAHHKQSFRGMTAGWLCQIEAVEPYLHTL